MWHDVFKKVAIGIVAASLVMGVFAPLTFVTYAKGTGEALVPAVYEFSEKDKYEFLSAEKSTEGSSVGTLLINGERYTVGKIGSISDFAVKKDYLNQSTDYNLSLSYVYNESLLNATDEQWHLVSDSGKNVDYIELDSKIGKGALIVQTSKDQSVWITTYTDTNIFESDKTGKKDFYQTTDVQLVNQVDPTF